MNQSEQRCHIIVDSNEQAKERKTKERDQEKEEKIKFDCDQ